MSCRRNACNLPNAIEIIPRFQLQWRREKHRVCSTLSMNIDRVLRTYIHTYIYIYVPLFHRACQFRDCISARITASTSTSSSSSLDCIPNLRFILYARTVSGMGLKRSPLDVQPVWSGYNCTRVFHRFRSGIEPKIVLNRKVFCTRNTFARIIYFTRIFFHSFFLSFFSLE